MADEPLIEARGLTKRFGDLVAVDGIDFAVERGETFGFLGPNGAGKSSTMRMIGAVSPPSGGTLRVLGRDLGLGLTEEDLNVDSPYNTRKNPGLPPTPIEAPGDAAIEAAAHPTKGPWVYYVTVNLDTGETKFTDDYDEFLRFKNVELAEYCAGSDRC